MFPKPDPRPAPIPPPTPEPSDAPNEIPPPSAGERETKEWTVMFYFASDNSLASAIVSQLKAIKDAGFHKDVNVIARYDPHDGTTPAHIFDVNLGEKLLTTKDHHIGFQAADPFVRTLVGDKLWSTERDRKKRLIRDVVKRRFEEQGSPFPYDPPEPDPLEPVLPPPSGPPEAAMMAEGAGKNKRERMKEPSPEKSLQHFLNFCAKQYPAQHYMLFILGHGIVVGNDLFLFDAHTDEDEHALSLKKLRERLDDFGTKVGKDKFELVSFHSCSMSSLEVAYELKGTAKYMLASQGPAFVGSWPYKQIVIRVFNDVKQHGKNIDVVKMLTKIFDYCFYNSYDFQLAGYSFDVCLTDLQRAGNPAEDGVKAALKGLSGALSRGLAEGHAVAGREHGKKAALANLARDLITLSHWQAQSYYEENFTDLGDFCFCLKRRCEDAELLFSDKLPPSIAPLKEACKRVLTVLACNKPAKPELRNETDEKIRKASPIIKTAFAGPAYQYSHGLSIYFPWSRPEDNRMWDDEYEHYELSKDTGWKQFLEDYFDTTKRDPQGRERKDAHFFVPELNEDAQLLEYVGGLIFNEAGQLKSSPYDKTGDDCKCMSMKNYPRITTEDDPEAVSASPDELQGFQMFESSGE